MAQWLDSEESARGWEAFDLETLKFIFERSKIKFDEVLAESEKITERTHKLVTVFFAVVIILLGSTYKRPPHEFIIGLILALAIVDIILFYFLLFGTKVVLRGTDPSTLFSGKVLTIETEKKLRRVYYDEIIRIHRGLETNRLNIGNKRKWHYVSIVISFFLFSGASVLVLGYISSLALP